MKFRKDFFIAAERAKLQIGFMAAYPYVLSAFFLAFGAVSPALASSTAWVESEGGRIRLVTAGKPDASGKLLGALQIDLKPGWKTYWRDPGDAGVPPTIDVSKSTNVVGVEVAFPAPTRFDDGYSAWAGYDRPVSLPVTFTIPAPDRFALIEADIFLGICQTICIPVSAKVTLDPASAADDPADASTVASAFATLPAPADSEFGILAARLENSRVIVEAAVPEAAGEPDLFVASTEGWTFGVPERLETTRAKAFFAIPIISAPEPAASADGIHYTLAAGDAAVSGTFDLYPE